MNTTAKNTPRRASGADEGVDTSATGQAAAPAPTPMPEPAGGWPRDEFTGQAGRFVRDPFTGIRSRAVEPALSPAATTPADGQ
jgi:hypothetical protein